MIWIQTVLTFCLATQSTTIDVTYKGDDGRKVKRGAAGGGDEASRQDSTTREFSVDFAGNVGGTSQEHGTSMVRKVAINTSSFIVGPSKHNHILREVLVDFIDDVDASSPAQEHGVSMVRQIEMDTSGLADVPSKLERSIHQVSANFTNNADKTILAQGHGVRMVRKAAMNALGRADAPAKQERRTHELSVDFVGNVIDVAALPEDIDGDHNGTDLDFNTNKRSEAINAVTSWTSSRPQAQHDISRRSAGVLYELDKSTAEAHNASGKVADRSTALAYSPREDLQITTQFANLSDGIMPMSLISQRSFFSTFTMVLLMIVALALGIASGVGLVSLVLFLYGRVQERRVAEERYRQTVMEERQRKRKIETAVGDLRVAAQDAVKEAVLSEHIDWRQTLNKLRELRKDKFNKTHLFYSKFEAYMEDPGMQAQLQSLFSELSEGKQLLTTDKLRFMFSNMSFRNTHLKTGQVAEYPPISYEQMCNCGLKGFYESEEPLPFSTFENIFVIFFVVSYQLGMIFERGDGTTQAERGDDVPKWKFEHFVEIAGRVVFRGCLDFQKDLQAAGRGSRESADLLLPVASRDRSPRNLLNQASS